MLQSLFLVAAVYASIIVIYCYTLKPETSER